MQEEAIHLISGRWRSQVLYAGVVLGVFDKLTTKTFQTAEALGTKLSVNAGALYRLMRALASIGVTVEDNSRAFAASELGDLFRFDHPRTLRYRVLAAEGPEH